MRSPSRQPRLQCWATAALAGFLFACGDDSATPEGAALGCLQLACGDASGTPEGAGPPTSLDASGAGLPDQASEDPGKPDTMYGTKAGLTLFLEEQEVGYVFYSALCPQRADQAQLFARVDFGGSMGISDAYLSLVMDRAEWHADEYSAALGGRVRIALKDGRTYAADARDLTIRLSITSAAAGELGEYYLKGAGTMTVPSTQVGLPPLTAKLTIN